MRALTWHGKHDVRVETMPDPQIVNPRDAIIQVTSTAICGSDLHLFDGVIPGMQAGDILGHEFMGVVEDVGAESTLAKGDRVELRGFGAFSVKARDARQGRNPRTGESVQVDEKKVPFFKTGKLLRDRLNGA